MMNEDSQIKVILINCYGGALDLEDFGRAMRSLKKNFKFTKPVVARFKGLGADETIESLKELNCKYLHIVDEYDGAVKLAVKLANN